MKNECSAVQWLLSFVLSSFLSIDGPGEFLGSSCFLDIHFSHRVMHTKRPTQLAWSLFKGHRHEEQHPTQWIQIQILLQFPGLLFLKELGKSSVFRTMEYALCFAPFRSFLCAGLEFGQMNVLDALRSSGSAVFILVMFHSLS